MAVNVITEPWGNSISIPTLNSATSQLPPPRFTPKPVIPLSSAFNTQLLLGNNLPEGNGTDQDTNKSTRIIQLALPGEPVKLAPPLNKGRTNVTQPLDIVQQRGGKQQSQQQVKRRPRQKKTASPPKSNPKFHWASDTIVTEEDIDSEYGSESESGSDTESEDEEEEDGYNNGDSYSKTHALISKAFGIK
jgi:hypothetical protein